MNEESNSRLSRTSEITSLQTVATTNTSQGVDVEDGTSTPSTEDDINLQCTSSDANKDSNNEEREPIFVIVDSSNTSNPSSKEILINKRNTIKEATIKRNLRHNVIPVDIPCTSTEQTNFILTQEQESDSREELQMVDINLQSENEIEIDNVDNAKERESIVVAYLRNKDAITDDDGLTITRKKSSLLENVPKMETIPENKQFTLFSGQLSDSLLESQTSTGAKNENDHLSEHSLDVHIPSYPGSPRSLHFGSGHSLGTFEEQDPNLRQAIAFLHQDKDFLIAAEIGNDKLLEMQIRRGTDVQQIDHLGRNGLHLAVCSDSLRAVKVLLDAGVNPNIKDNVGMTPLSLCLMRRPSLIVANLLFDYGAKLLPRSGPMDTGLFIQFVMMCTPTEEEKNILRLLIDKGAIINDLNAPGGRQALHFAAMSNNTMLIRILVSLGADLYMTNHRNENPREVAATFKCKDAYELLCELEAANELAVSSSITF